LQQARNVATVDSTLFDRRVSNAHSLSPEAVADLQLATIVVKHTVSNAVCVTHAGQAIGIGGGQQARIYATRAACDKADAWRLHLHPRASEIKAPSRAQRVQAVRRWVEAGSPTTTSQQLDAGLPAPLAPDERQEWLEKFAPVVLSSDGYIPFRDNVDRARVSRIHAIAQPGGSLNDASVTEAANEAGIVMIHTGLRLFLH
jgi:AICAR transformylase/IMP cyclohydrolase PurH